MCRPRARAGRLAVVGGALVLLLTGCGGSPATKHTGPSKETVACRGEWKDLGKEVQGNDQKTTPSALTSRWNSVVATIDYYSTSAKSSDCGDAIDQQKKAITALTSFGTKLTAYDMELRLEQVRDGAQAYAAAPRPPRPSPTPAPKGKKHHKQKKAKPAPLPPKPADIATALKTLTRQAPLATQQQGPGWSQARVVELSDSKAVAKAVKDLAFLSDESAAYRACRKALGQIRLALAARS